MSARVADYKAQNKLPNIDLAKVTPVLDCINLGVYIVNRQHEIQYVNPVILREFGPVAGRKCYQYFHGRQDKCPWCKNDEVFAGNTVKWKHCLSLKRKYYSIVDIPLFLPGEILKLGLLYDVTKEKLTEKALKESERRFRAIFDCMYQFISLLQPDGTVIEANKTSLDFAGLKRRDVVGRPFWETRWWQLSPETREQLKEAIKRAARGEFIRYEVDVLGAGDNVATLDFSIKPVFNDRREVVLLIPEGRNISELKHLKKEMARLERLNLVGQMAAGISHEIRNPLTTVRGFLQFLKDKPGVEKYKSYFKTMIEELDRANSIINEYLSLARNKPINLEKHNLNVIIKNLYPLIAANAKSEDKHVQLGLGATGDLLVDEKEMRQLILNLTRNGLEAMPPGGCLTIYTKQEGRNVLLMVEDEGEGIREDILDKLGTPFLTTKEQGTGLGLATCYSIAERHGAEILVDTSSSGSIFTVKFKLPGANS